jgi:hypothetical protein
MKTRRRLQWNARCRYCVNCGSDGADRRPNGYCARCSPAAQKLRLMGTWDREDPDTWTGCAFRGRIWFEGVGVRPQDYFGQAKSMLETELHNRKHLEAQLHGDEPIDGLAIEYALIELGRVVKIPHPDHYHAWATPIDHTLGTEEKQMVYGWLQDFLMNRPRPSIWIRAYHAAMRHRERARRIAEPNA